MNSSEKPNRPLGGKAYGSIGHLPGSRLGPGDHHVSEGQARICTERLRDKHDRVFVQEKLDGTCVAVAKIDGKLYPLGRKGYPADTSPYEYIRMFHDWALQPKQAARFDAILSEGERIVGEWLAMAVGTRYDLRKWNDDPFVPFDIMRGTTRVSVTEFYPRILGDFAGPPIYWNDAGKFPVAVETAHGFFSRRNTMQACDPIEGVVYRVERHGKVDFLAKWVRPDKVDGCYLPEVSGKEPIWNWKP